MSTENEGSKSAVKISACSLESGLSSIQEAISLARRLQKDAELVETNKAIAGEIITSVEWEDDRAILILETTAVSIWAAKHGLQWNSEALAADARMPKGTRAIFLDFGIEGQPPSHWERARILESRIGKQIRRLSVSEFGLILDVHGLKPLLFSRLRQEFPTDNAMLLFWDTLE